MCSMQTLLIVLRGFALPATRHNLGNLLKHEVVFPVHWITFVPAILSHFLSIDPLNSYPLQHANRHTLP